MLHRFIAAVFAVCLLAPAAAAAQAPQAPAFPVIAKSETLAFSHSANRAASTWVRVNTTAQGQFLTALQAKLVSDFGQTAGSYDYSVVKKLSVSGTLSSQDYTDLRSAAYAGTSIQELDLSGIVDSTTYALSGMTALTDVSLPAVGSYTLANPFQGNTSLRNVVVAAETYTFCSTTTFNGITSLQRITFLHTTKPSMNASTFAGSNNADASNRKVIAVVPDKTRGDYDATTFTQYFATVTEAAGTEDFAELQSVIDDATAIGRGSAAAEYRWTLLQQAITAAMSVHDNAASSSAAVHRARLVLQTAINRVGVAELGLSLKVTRGAEVTLSWKNGTAQHYAEFTPHPVAKVDVLSDDAYDIYVPTTTVPYVTQNVATAVIHGQTDKVAKIFTTSAATASAQYTLALTPLAQRADTALLIPGLGAGDNRGLYTNLDDTGVVNLDVGEHFDLDTIRTQQAQLDQINNLFIEPDYTFDVAGESVTTRGIGLEGRRQLRITAARPGVSVVKISYGPLRYLAANDNGTPGATNWSFNGIDPQDTGLAVINVGGEAGTFDTGIDVKNELDTYYFDQTVGERDFTFTPAAGTTVRVHDPLNVSAWGSGWRTYDAAADGSFTVKLKAGRNIVQLTNGGKVQYRVVRAKGVDVTVTNTTNPGQPFAAGDNARVSVTGIEGGVEKLGGIYNPAFNAGTKGKLTYYDGASQLVSNEATQYQSAITTFNVDYVYTGTGDKALNGDMFIGGLGAEWPYHRQIPLEGKPANLAAVAIGPYHFGSLPTIYVHGDQVNTSPAAPGAPTGLRVSYGDGSAALAWTAPTSTGGLPVVGYRVRYSSDGGAHWQTETFGTGTAQTLTGLTNGTEYAVQVAAFNSSATGSYSASQTVTPRTVPGTPANLTLTPRHTALELSWTAPGSGGSPITGYRVRYSSDAGQTWVTQDYGTATTQRLTGLTDRTAYAVQVAAINAEGPGAFTASAVATPAKTGAVLTAPTVEDLTTTSARIVTDVNPGDLAQSLTVEFSTNADHSGATSSSATTVAAGSEPTTVTTALSGLTAGTEHFYRVILTASDGEIVSSPWAAFITAAVSPPVVLPAPVTVDIPLAPATLTVKASTGIVHVGRRLTVTVTGLKAGETYRITIAGVTVATGVVPASGSLSTTVQVPNTLRDGTVPIQVLGAADDRAGSSTLNVVASKTLTVKVTKAQIGKGGKQRVSISGLAARERVRIVYRGKRIAVLTASKRGTASKTFTVGASAGKKTVTVYGVSNDRTGAKTFKVTR